MRKMDRFNKISLVLAIGCAVGFYYADEGDFFFGKEMMFTLLVTFGFFTIWK